MRRSRGPTTKATKKGSLRDQAGGVAIDGVDGGDIVVPDGLGLDGDDAEGGNPDDHVVLSAAARAERAAAADAAAAIAESAAANTSYLIIQRPREPLFLEKGQIPSFLSQTSEFSVSFYSNFF